VVGARLRRAVSSSDLVGRQGGDEFVLFLPRLTMQARKRPRGIFTMPYRASVSDYVQHRGGAFTRAPTSLDAAVKAADDLMYRAKVGGKNATIHESVKGLNG
jgi:PleD family two-component response regulator